MDVPPRSGETDFECQQLDQGTHHHHRRLGDLRSDEETGECDQDVTGGRVVGVSQRHRSRHDLSDEHDSCSPKEYGSTTETIDKVDSWERHDDVHRSKDDLEDDWMGMTIVRKLV